MLGIAYIMTCMECLRLHQLNVQASPAILSASLHGPSFAGHRLLSALSVEKLHAMPPLPLSCLLSPPLAFRLEIVEGKPSRQRLTGPLGGMRAARNGMGMGSRTSLQ